MLARVKTLILSLLSSAASSSSSSSHLGFFLPALVSMPMQVDRTCTSVLWWKNEVAAALAAVRTNPKTLLQ
jgi:hypothetical protein